MLFSALLSCALALGATAQIATRYYTESKSGITVFAYVDTPYVFGIALPPTPTTDFIGVMVVKGTGWGGVSLGGAMLNELLIAAWPTGVTNKVLGSFRKTSSYVSPAVATGAYSMVPIANGTYTNSTHFTYTFLCKKCIMTDGTTFKTTDTLAVLGYAISSKAPTTKTSATTTFAKHDTQGNYQLDLASTKNAKYDTWAAYANTTGSTPGLVFTA